jgi:16S rRNA (cytidine1402-2'-O)-methyltransferase
MSAPKPNQGKLVMATNSLGRAEDIPQRSLAALRHSDLLVFEEDRPARQSLKAAGIHRRYLKYTEHDEHHTLKEIEDCLRKGGTVCYMSDQGVPVLADPGQSILQLAYRLQSKVEVIPGPSSVTAALAACPFLTTGFLFAGFLPRDAKKREAALKKYQRTPVPIVIMDTPYRRQAVTEAANQVMGNDRQALLALDISGPDEEYLYCSLRELVHLDRPKLNFVLVIAPEQPASDHNETKRRRSPSKRPKRKP